MLSTIGMIERQFSVHKKRLALSLSIAFVWVSGSLEDLFLTPFVLFSYHIFVLLKSSDIKM